MPNILPSYAQLLFAIVIFALSLLGGLVPIYFQFEQNRRRLYTASLFSRGLFLGIGYFHVLPDAIAHLRDAHYTAPAVIVLLIGLAATLLFISVDAFLHRIRHSKLTFNIKWISYLLAALLSVHSVAAGTAMGIETDFTEAFLLFIAVVAHKSPAAFALGVNMRIHHIQRFEMLAIMLLFSSMTPIGILFGNTLVTPLQATTYLSLKGGLDATLVGVFTFLGIFDHSSRHLRGNATPPMQLLAFILGLAGPLLITMI